MTDDYDPRDWYDRAQERGQRATRAALGAFLGGIALMHFTGRLLDAYREAEDDHGAAAAAANVERARRKREGSRRR